MFCCRPGTSTPSHPNLTGIPPAGLEFIVDRLKNPTKPDTAAPSLDITCVVCGLDFSPEWEKTDLEDKFECYYCFTSKLRKTVILLHTFFP